MSAITQKVKHLRIENEMTIYTAADMKARFASLFEQDAIVELDLSGVSEFDTSGLQLLVMAKRECIAKGGNLKLMEHSSAVLEVLDMCGMLQFFGDPVVMPAKSR